MSDDLEAAAAAGRRHKAAVEEMFAADAERRRLLNELVEAGHDLLEVAAALQMSRRDATRSLKPHERGGEKGARGT
jgi:hypothetical protein